MPHIDLLELPYFYGIELDELVELIDQMTPRRVKAGDWLVRVGQPVFLNIATHGKIGIHRHADDPTRPAIIYERKAPTLFGEIELFCGVTSIADVQAITDVEAFELTRDTFSDLFAKRHPAMTQFVFNVAKVASHRLMISDAMLLKLDDGKTNLSDLRQHTIAQLRREKGGGELTGTFKIPTKISEPEES
jgi:CRP-like cAMP-binding protein